MHIPKQYIFLRISMFESLIYIRIVNTDIHHIHITLAVQCVFSVVYATIPIVIRVIKVK